MTGGVIVTFSKTEFWVKHWHNTVRFIEKILQDNKVDYRYYDIEDLADLDLTGWDIINVGNHQYVGSKKLYAIGKSLKRCDRLISHIDDYANPLATQIRQAVIGKPNIFISNMPKLLEWKKESVQYNWATECIYMNWNKLSYNPIPFGVPLYEGVLYFGAFRKKRAAYFEKYLGIDATDFYPVNVSSNKKSLKLFLDMNPCLDEFSKPEQLLPFLQQFKMMVYMEDTPSHTLYNSPANRFYECISAGLPMVFDINTVHTFEEAGYDVNKFVVQEARDIPYFLSIWEKCRDEQLQWRRDYIAEGTNELTKIFKQIGVINESAKT